MDNNLISFVFLDYYIKVLTRLLKYSHTTTIIDKNMKKVDMMNQVGISSSTVAKMTNGELVSMKVLEKICEKLDCDFGDIVHYEKETKDGGQ